MQRARPELAVACQQVFRLTYSSVSLRASASWGRDAWWGNGESTACFFYLDHVMPGGTSANTIQRPFVHLHVEIIRCSARFVDQYLIHLHVVHAGER